jgi:predicted transcriptional regulator
MWKEVSFILKSSRRKDILIPLETPRTPTYLAKQTKSSLANISLKLGDLKTAGLIRCVNPSDRKGRIYELTDKGKKVLSKIKEIET